MQKTLRDQDHEDDRSGALCFSRYDFSIDKPIYAYAGSTLQQNYGEPLLGHGFLLWHLPQKQVECYHVRNDYGFLNIFSHLTSSTQEDRDRNPIFVPYVEMKKPYRSDDPGKSNTSAHDQPHRIPLEKLQDYTRVMPHTLRVRFKLHESIAFEDPQFIDNTLSTLRSMGYAIESSDVMYLAPKQQADGLLDSQSSSRSAHRELDDLENVDIRRFNSPDVWCEYLKGKMDVNEGQEEETEWQKWVRDPSHLRLKKVFDPSFFDSVLPETIRKSVIDRDAKTEKECDVFRQDLEMVLSQDSHRHVSFEITCMSWSYILCFGPQCYFDFQKLDQKVHCIGGKNGYGKTSFLETICIALFGEGFPSRTSKQYSSSILHEKLPKNTRPFTSINIRLNHMDAYNIKRVFTRNSGDKNKLINKEVSISRIDENGNIIAEVHSGMRATQHWIAHNVGSLQTFLTSCMISQNNEHDFFDKKPAEQKTYLDQQLNFSSTHNFLAALKSSSNAHKDITTRLHDTLHFYHDSMLKCSVDDAQLEQAEKATSDAHTHITESEGFIAQNPISLSVQNDFQEILASLNINPSCTEEHLSKDAIHEALSGAFDQRFDVSLCREKAHTLQTDQAALEKDIQDKTDMMTRISHILEAEENKVCDRETSTDALREQYDEHVARGQPRFAGTPDDNIKDSALLLQEKRDALKADLDRLYKEYGGDGTAQKAAIHELEREAESIESDKALLVQSIQDASDVELPALEKGISDHQCIVDDILARQQSETLSRTVALDEKAYIDLKERLASFTEYYTSIDNVNHYIDKLDKQCTSLLPRPAKSALEIEVMREENKTILRKVATHPIIGAFAIQHEIDKTSPSYVLLSLEHESFGTFLSEKLQTLREEIQGGQEKCDKLQSKITNRRSAYADAQQKQESCMSALERVMQERPATHVRASSSSEDNPDAIRKELDSLKTNICMEGWDDPDRWSRAQSYIHEHSDIDSKMTSYHDICSLLNQCEDYPFNPACAACLNHPWKQKRDALLGTQRDLEAYLDTAASALECPLADLSEKHSQICDYFNRAQKSQRDREGLERRLREAQEMCDAQKREEAWVCKKVMTQDALASSKRACVVAQEEMESLASERVDVEKALSGAKDHLASLQELSTYREEYMTRHSDIASWSKWTKKNDKKMALRDITETWKQDLVQIEDYEKAYEHTLRKKNNTETLQNSLALLQRLRQEKDSILSRMHEHQTRLHGLDMRAMRLHQDIHQKQTGLCDLETALSAHGEVCDKLSFLEEWSAWHAKKEELAHRIKILEYHQTLDLLEKDLGALRHKAEQLQNEMDRLALQIRKMESFDLWYNHTYHRLRIASCQSLLSQRAPELTLLRERKKECFEFAKKVDHVTHYVRKMTLRAAMLERMMDHFACFKTWVIESKVIPSITEKVNLLLEHFCTQHRHIALAYDFIRTQQQKSEGGHQIAWFIKEGHQMTLPIEKASGFQRFVINLAMRIVLGKFGICGIKNKQLFIDEGFTSFDQDNLENVPHMLRDLLLPLFKSIIIVTHLETIQNHIPSYIPITRDATRATSVINFGAPEHKSGRKIT